MIEICQPYQECDGCPNRACARAFGVEHAGEVAIAASRVLSRHNPEEVEEGGLRDFQYWVDHETSFSDPDKTVWPTVSVIQHVARGECDVYNQQIRIRSN